MLNDHCLKFEVDVCAHDIYNWREEDRHHEMACLVSDLKRQRSDVKLSQLSIEDKARFHEAKLKEVGSWISTETISKILRNQIPKENILRCRWILTWKGLDENDGTSKTTTPKFKPKTRLVVLGFEDPDGDSSPRDSPIMNKLTRMLILQHAASSHWDI